MKYFLLLTSLICLLLQGCDMNKNPQQSNISSTQDSLAGYGMDIKGLPKPNKTKSYDHNGKAIGWPDDLTPKAPEDFIVSKFADNLDHPRWIYVGPNGDVFIAEANDKGSADRITLLRDTDGDGQPEINQPFIDEGLKQPIGMLILDGHFYVANVDGILRFPYETGMDKITGEGEKILELPAGGYNHHWTRNIISNADGSKIYVSVGSASNVGEYGMDEEKRRANILIINPDGSGEEVYASGLRNPVGMDWAPGTNTLWTAVNERDELGDNLVPDYITGVKKGAFYGWPYAYFGPNKDPRMADKSPEMVEKTIAPDVAVGAHTASLGLTFYDGDAFPEKYKNGAFVAQHGSWNRSTLNGYRVLFVPFANGKPSGPPEDFLTGFIADQSKYEVYGRPVCVTVSKDGALLLSDDDSNTIWRISAE